MRFISSMIDRAGGYVAWLHIPMPFLVSQWMQGAFL